MNNEWCAIDLHMHTCEGITGDGSRDKIDNFTYFNYISSLKGNDIKLAAITNHNKIDLVNYLISRFLGKIAGINILFGVELDLEMQCKKLNYHCVAIFDESLNHCLEIKDLINDKTDEMKSKFNKVRYSPDDLIELIKKYNVILIPHGNKSKGVFKNATEEMILEALKKVKDGYIRVFDSQSDLKLAEIKRFMKENHQNFEDNYGGVLFSDNRNWLNYKKYFRDFYMNAEPTFKGFLHSITNPTERFSLKQYIPFKSSYISKIKITQKDKDARIKDCEINLKSGFNCIVGKSGSGKSLLEYLIKHSLCSNLSEDGNYDFSDKNNIELFDENNNLIDKDSINIGIGKNIFSKIVVAVDTKSNKDIIDAIKLIKTDFKEYDNFNSYVEKYRSTLLNYIKLKDEQKLILEDIQKDLNNFKNNLLDLEKLKDVEIFNIEIKDKETFEYSDISLQKLKTINQNIINIQDSLKLVKNKKNENLLRILKDFKDEYLNLMKEIYVNKYKTEYINRKIEAISNSILKINKDISGNSQKKNKILHSLPDEIKNISNKMVKSYIIKTAIKNFDLSIKIEEMNEEGFLDKDKIVRYSELVNKDSISNCNEKSNKIFNTRGFSQELDDSKVYNLCNKNEAKNLIDIYINKGLTEEKISKIFESFKPEVNLYFENENVKQLNPGSIAKNYIKIYFNNELNNNKNSIILYDQIENDVDKEFISTSILENIREAKKKAQLIIITHDPIVAINGDPVNYIEASKDDDGKISYKNFSFESMENESISSLIKNVDGSLKVIKERYEIYSGEKDYEDKNL